MAGAAVFLSGCATGPKEAASARRYVFFPPAPGIARYQYLTSFAEEADLGGSKGGFAAFVTGERPESQKIIKPYGMALRGTTLYVCDTIAFAVDIIDLRTGKLRRFRPEGEGRLGKPVNVAVDEDGTMYVADTAWGMVLIYGPDGQFKGSIGVRGKTKPADVLVRGDRLYITDLLERAIKVYDKRSLKELWRIPRPGDVPQSVLRSPVNLAVGPDGRIAVSDFGDFCVKIYDSQGRFLRKVGELGDHIGGMVRPKGVALDHANRLYVVDAAAEVVQVFDEQGRLLLFFGEPTGSEVGLVLPAKIILSYDPEVIDLFRRHLSPDFKAEYLVFVTSQYGPRKVSVFAFGHRISQEAQLAAQEATATGAATEAPNKSR
ncbi:MAG: hypothetical protein D6766_02305 [Verrucomicrobia bacterium]|nr:MAG: hypothetical protein D6766_02305 [Verrucomicrobiota bacterium]